MVLFRLMAGASVMGSALLLALLPHDPAATGGGQGGAGGLEAWRSLLLAKAESPMTPGSGDQSLDWTGADGRPVRVVVKAPAPAPGAPVVTLARVAPGEDARPAFEAAIRRAQETHAGRIVMPTGDYVLKSAAAGEKGHVLLSDLSDLTIDGQDSKIVFANPGDGFRLSSVQRIRLVNMTLDYSTPTWGTGVVTGAGGAENLVMDAPFDSTGKQVYQVSGFDRGNGSWTWGGSRIFFKGSDRQGLAASNRSDYASPKLKGSRPNENVAVKFHYYNGAAIRIWDSANQKPSEDITIDNVHILASTGMGISVKIGGRGVAIINSSVSPEQGSGKPFSAEYDGIYVSMSRGDILIRNNHISGQGDDAININSPIHEISGASPGGQQLQLSNRADLTRVGDRIAFFDDSGNFLFSSVVRALVSSSGDNATVELDKALPEGEIPRYARNVDLSSSRYAILGNDIRRCECHGVLAQTSNGLIRENSFSDLRFNAIRLLTSLSPWKEGTGAFNVVVEGNTIARTGPDKGYPFPWAAISVYGHRGPNLIPGPVNANIVIRNNSISDVAQDCIMIASSVAVTDTANRCVNLRQMPLGSSPVDWLKAGVKSLPSALPNGGTPSTDASRR